MHQQISNNAVRNKPRIKSTGILLNFIDSVNKYELIYRYNISFFLILLVFELNIYTMFNSKFEIMSAFQKDVEILSSCRNRNTY